MEQRWFVWGFLGEQVAEPWGDWTVDEPWDEDADGRWHVAATSPPRSSSSGSGDRRPDPVGAAGLPDAATRRRAGGSPTTRRRLEWICFHVLAEYARHAGHLDIAVELATK